MKISNAYYLLQIATQQLLDEVKNSERLEEQIQDLEIEVDQLIKQNKKDQDLINQLEKKLNEMENELVKANKEIIRLSEMI